MADPQQPEPGADPAGPPELEEHPGRPRRPDELDPELMRLPRPRPKIGWLLSLSVVVLCGYVMFRLRADVVFSREPDTAQVVDRLDQLFTGDVDRHVAIDVVPDRAYALRAARSQQRLYPALGTDGRLWLLLPGSAWDDPPRRDERYGERYSGRLKRLDDLAFAAPLAEHLGKLLPRPRHVTGADLREALRKKANRIEHASGDSLELLPTTEVTVSQRSPGEVRVIAERTDEYSDEASWRAALIRIHLLDRNGEPTGGDADTGWRYIVAAPDGVDAVDAKLAAAGLSAAYAEPIMKDVSAPWSTLAETPHGLAIRDAEIGWDDIVQASVAAKRRVPAGARVIVVAEKPGDYWYVMPLFAALSLAALAFGWAFARSLRSGQSTREPAASAAG